MEDQSPFRLISSTGAPQRKAYVAPPRQKLWPEYCVGFRPAEQREQRNLGVNTACVIGLVRAPLEYRKAGEEGGAGNRPTWRS